MTDKCVEDCSDITKPCSLKCMQNNGTVTSNISFVEKFELSWPSLYPNMSEYIPVESLPNVTAYIAKNTTHFYFDVAMPNMSLYAPLSTLPDMSKYTPNS